MSTKVPGNSPKRDAAAIPGGVSNEIPPLANDDAPVRRQDDLTIRGADAKDLSPPPQITEAGKQKSGL